MVLLNGKAQPSCMIPVSSVKEMTVTTLEGLPQNNKLHPYRKPLYRNRLPSVAIVSTAWLLRQFHCWQKILIPMIQLFVRVCNDRYVVAVPRPALSAQLKELQGWCSNK
jgi:hypothetical protein